MDSAPHVATAQNPNTPSAAVNTTPHVKDVNEATRERETFKYDPSLFADFRFNDTGVPIASSEIKSSPDSTLTGLVQLGAYQTGAERSFASLFDANYQYIVAEAVPGMSLAPNLPSNKCRSPLVLRGVAIPRKQGTCEHVLYHKNPDPKDDPELPISLVPNLGADDRFNTKPYCQFGNGGQFYAAVPIRTHRGINIGSYCVMSVEQPKGWSDVSVDLMREVSRAIMAHLEGNRSSNTKTSNELLNKGMRSFLAGQSSLFGLADGAKTLGKGTNQDGSTSPKLHFRRPLGPRGYTIQGPAVGEEGSHQEPPSHGQVHGLEAKTPQVQIRNPFEPPRRRRSPKHGVSNHVSGVDHSARKGQGHANLIFSRAANIMREAFDVEGCLFLDVSLGSHRRQSSPMADKADETGSVPSATSSSDDRFSESLGDSPDSMSDLMGFSTAGSSSINDSASLDEEMGMVPRKVLAKLIRRHPSGKIFHFDMGGELQSSDSSDDGEPSGETEDPADDEDGASKTAKQVRSRRRSRKEGALIHAAFPDARSVAFIPVWDLKRERWFAAGFLYTLRPTRVFTVDAELSFLKAFANLAATEVLNREIIVADQAKSDALGSLSHELRSPLHGVLLGTELLNDTDLDVFQGNLTHTIETCCCTLLDTIDHLLDYSKINSFAAKRRQTPGASRGNGRQEQFGKKQLMTSFNLDDLVEEVADSMFAGYSFQHLPNGRSSALDDLVKSEPSQQRRAWQKPAQLGPRKFSNEQQGGGKVSVYLAIDSSYPWMFDAEPGAVRRVVMNLLGNALKYTAEGNIYVTLTQTKSQSKRTKTDKVVKLVVRDTGKGISQDFLRYKLFQPFSQEDELLPGTGLGLSLVKTIVAGMGGQISAQSEVGVGSTFTVTLPLEPSTAIRTESLTGSASRATAFEEQARDMKGLRLRVFGFESKRDVGNDKGGRDIIESICRDWLHLDVHSPGDPPEMAPDLVLWSHEALPDSTEQLAQLAQAPNIIVCHDAQMARRLSREYDGAGYQGVFEFVSQPIGPRKLARSMQLAYKRWTGLTQMVTTPKPTATPQTPGVPQQDIATPGSAFARPSPLQELSALSLDTRLSPRIDTNREMSASYFPSGTSIVEEPPETPKYSDKDTFLLVDDNQVNLKVLAAYMAKLKLVFVTATNGKEAVDTYLEEPSKFTAILMDLSMPVMDGLEATRQIRAHERKNQLEAVSIFALTGLASDRIHKEAFESGVDVFLTKPVRLQTLRQELGLAP